MRMSCNGCRILRKGCGDDCIIKPCLDWIKSPDAQANATLFLAKFYARAGLINLIEAGPLHLRPAIFKSLLYEACGRIVDPISGSVGLLWSGKWEQCQAAVESVLRGSPITQNPYYSSSSSTASSSTNSSINAPPIVSLSPFDHHPTPPPPPPPSPKLKFYDIRHVSKHHHHQHHGSLSNTKPKTCRLKRTSNYKPKADHFSGSPSHLSREDESIFSIETVELSYANSRNKAPQWSHNKNNGDVGLELTLSLSPSVNKLID